MRLVDIGLHAITAPTPASSSSSTGVAALAAVAGLAVLGAAKRCRDPLKGIRLFDFGGHPDGVALRKRFVEAMAAKGSPVRDPHNFDADTKAVWLDWVLEQGHPEGEYWAAAEAGQPFALVVQGGLVGLPSDLTVYFNNVSSGVNSADAPFVVRRVLDELGYDAEAIVPSDAPWGPDGTYHSSISPDQPRMFAHIAPVSSPTNAIRASLSCRSLPGRWVVPSSDTYEGRRPRWVPGKFGRWPARCWELGLSDADPSVQLEVRNFAGPLPRKVK